jgi:hypothetical protein
MPILTYHPHAGTVPSTVSTPREALEASRMLHVCASVPYTSTTETEPVACVVHVEG